MPHLWIEASQTGRCASDWRLWPLDGAAAVPLCPPGDDADAAARAAALLLCSRTAEGVAWLIMSTAPSGVALNGVPLRGGIRVLAERDEIRVAGFGRAFFSAERLAAVEIFAGVGRYIECPRCKREIVGGTPVVTCPTCARILHESAGDPCWTYEPRCVEECRQPTALDAGFRWSPRGL